MPKALFYFYNNTHAPLLLPVYRAMKNDSQWSIAFSFPKFDNLYKEGFPPEEENRLRNQGVKIVEYPQQWKADVTITAEPVAHKLERCGKLVNIGKGLISKGQIFSRHKNAYTNNFFDLVCSPGPAFTQKLKESKQVFTEIIETGLPKLDMLFAPNLAPRNELLRRLGKDPDKKTILYAPSWEIEFSSIPHFWTRIRQLANENTYLFIKLHGLTPKEWISPLRLLSEDYKNNIIFINDPDITPYIALSDMLVTDVASVGLEFITLDKPVVYFDNPNIEEYHRYTKDDIEYEYRDAGIRIKSFEELKPAVERCLNNPAEFAEKRKEYTSQLLHATDHHSSKRVVEAINNLLSENGKKRLTRKEITSVIIPIDHAELDQISKTVNNLINSSGETLVIFLVGKQNTVEQIINDHPEICQFIHIDTLDNPGSDWLAMVYPGVVGENRWMFRMINQVRRNKQFWGAVPMALFGNPIQDPVQRFGYIPEYNYDLAELDFNTKFSFTGEKFDILASVKPLCWVARNNTILSDAIINFFKSGKDLAGDAVKNTIITKDVLVEFPKPHVTNPKEQFDNSIRDQVIAAENRVNELSEWIGRILKPVNFVPAIKSPYMLGPLVSSRSSSPVQSEAGDINGHIRLAKHFIKRGKTEQAIDHVKLGLAVDATNQELQKLASELKIS